MAIFYTIYDGGEIHPLPIKSMRQKVVKRLNKHRNNKKLHVSTTGNFSHVKCPHVSYPYLVHSVFFCKGGKLKRIWDANLNGYRSKKFVKGIRLKLNKNK